MSRVWRSEMWGEIIKGISNIDRHFIKHQHRLRCCCTCWTCGKENHRSLEEVNELWSLRIRVEYFELGILNREASRTHLILYYARYYNKREQIISYLVPIQHLELPERKKRIKMISVHSEQNNQCTHGGNAVHWIDWSNATQYSHHLCRTDDALNSYIIHQSLCMYPLMMPK